MLVKEVISKLCCHRFDRAQKNTNLRITQRSSKCIGIENGANSHRCVSNGCRLQNGGSNLTVFAYQRLARLI